MELTEKAKEKLKPDKVIMAIALDIGKSYNTTRRWINESPLKGGITEKKSIKSIIKFTGLKENEIFKKE